MRLIDADALKDSMRGEFIDNVEERIAIREIDDAPTIKTKQIKYFDEDEQVWKIGEVIVE